MGKKSRLKKDKKREGWERLPAASKTLRNKRTEWPSSWHPASFLGPCFPKKWPSLQRGDPQRSCRRLSCHRPVRPGHHPCAGCSGDLSQIWRCLLDPGARLCGQRDEGCSPAGAPDPDKDRPGTIECCNCRNEGLGHTPAGAGLNPACAETLSLAPFAPVNASPYFLLCKGHLSVE